MFQGEFQGLGKFQGFQGRPRGPQPPEPLFQHKFKVPPVKSTKYKLLRYSRSLVAAAVAAGVAAVVGFYPKLCYDTVASAWLVCMLVHL